MLTSLNPSAPLPPPTRGREGGNSPGVLSQIIESKHHQGIVIQHRRHCTPNCHGEDVNPNCQGGYVNSIYHEGDVDPNCHGRGC